MEWWLWLVGGLALVVAELATPSGFFIIFFGIGAMAVGVLARFGVVTNLPLQVLTFSVAVGAVPGRSCAAASSASCRVRPVPASIP